MAAAGNNCENDATPEVVWPASIDSVFAVGAVDSLLNHWDYSCDGPEIDLVAPAGYWHLATEDSPYHWSTDNYEYDHAEYNPGFCSCTGRVTDGKYTLFGGTSAAAPLVAGVAALVWSQRPELTAPQVKALLRRSARDLGAPGRDDDYGYGLVDAYRAVTRWGTLGQTNYWSGEIHVSGDLTVAANDSLVLAPGTFIRVARDDNEFTGTDTTLVEILIHGTLLADSVTFTSFGTGSPGVSDWIGIRIAAGGKAVLNGVQIENASDDIIIDEFGLSVADWDTTKTLYLNSDHAIAANFTVAANESLFVLGESDVIVSGGNNVEIVVEGSLICKGSATKKPEFRSSTGQSSSWKLLTLAGGSENNLFHNVVFRHAEQAIRTFVPLTVDSCSFSNGIDGIQNHDDLVVRNSTFSDLSSSAFSVVDGDLFVQDVAVSGCGWGILQQPVDTTVSTGTIECIGSRIQNLSYRGINIHYPTDGVTIKHTLIENAPDGVFLGYQDSVVIDSCTIRKNDLGIVAIACGNLSIAHCAIDSNTTTGVYLEFMTSASLEADTVRYSPVGVFTNNGSGGTLAAAARLISNELGVKCDHESDLVIRNTLITGSETGVAAMNDSDVDLGHASGTNCGASGSDQGLNSIHTNSGYHVANFTSTTLPAEGNYWGSQGPKASKFTGSAAVDYNPYICSNPLASSFQIVPPPPDGEPKPRLPATYDLFASHPNPFNPTTTMRFDVPPRGGRVNIVIYDVSGARVRTLVSTSFPPGVHQITWDGHDDRAAPAASGVYFVRMTATSFTRTRKVVLLK